MVGGDALDVVLNTTSHPSSSIHVTCCLKRRNSVYPIRQHCKPRRVTRAQQTQYDYVKVVSDILNLFNYLNQARWVKELEDLITFRLTKKRLISKAKLHCCFLS